MDSEATDTQPDNPGYPDIHVGQTCYVQTAESRASTHVKPFPYTRVPFWLANFALCPRLVVRPRCS